MGTHSMQFQVHFDMIFSVKDLQFLGLSDSTFVLILSVLNWFSQKYIITIGWFK